jgi:uncharacterized protein YdaU (DUF1376 family)
MAQNGNGKLPWFPFFPKDWLTDDKVMAMNRAQRGSYWDLLCHAWFQRPIGTLPVDDGLLARFAGCTQEEWLVEQTVILAPFELKEGRYHQKRLVAVGLTQSQNHEKCVEAGRKGGFSKARARLEPGCSPATAVLLEPRSSNASGSVSDSPERREEDSKGEEKKTKNATRHLDAKPTNFGEMRDFALSHGMTAEDAKYCWSRWQTSGWKINKQPIQSWRHAMTSWRLAGYLPSTKGISK